MKTDKFQLAIAVIIATASLAAISASNSQNPVAIPDTMRQKPIEKLSIISKPLLDSSVYIQTERDSLLDRFDQIRQVQDKVSAHKEKIIVGQNTNFERFERMKKKLNKLDPARSATPIRLELPAVASYKKVNIDTAVIELPEITVPCSKKPWYIRIFKNKQ